MQLYYHHYKKIWGRMGENADGEAVLGHAESQVESRKFVGEFPRACWAAEKSWHQLELK